MRNRYSLRLQQITEGLITTRKCVECRQQRKSLPNTPTRQQVVSSMYAYLMTSWDELPDENKRALGFDFVVGSEGEEVALNHLARLFMDYADLSFRRALVARRRRLGIDA
ncbi:hypothetical protein [Pseudomonas maioricensis]|nr:hypothetical protein [Pseudomonas sp. S25]